MSTRTTHWSEKCTRFQSVQLENFSPQIHGCLGVQPPGVEALQPFNLTARKPKECNVTVIISS